MRRPVIRIGRMAAAFAASALLAATMALAQETAAPDPRDKWYQVDIIVFERIGAEFLDAEAWDIDPGHPPIEQSIALIAPGESPIEGPGPHAFRILPEDQQVLLKTRGHLSRAADMKPILHVAWRQLGLPKDDAQWVNLYVPPRDSGAGGASGTRLSEGANVAPGAHDPQAISEPTLIPFDALQTPLIFPPVLDGTFRLHLARYLHADVDLVYHREGVETPFRLTTSRRMRSGELHYLDHPLFGVLIKVTPFEPNSLEEKVSG